MDPSTPHDYLQIPELYRGLTRWVLFRIEGIDEKHPDGTKVPYQANGRKASSNDRTTWTRFGLALAALERGAPDGTPFAGLGFMRTDDFVFFDLDGCLRPDGSYEQWDWEGPQPGEIVAALEPFSYIETSISGLGVHSIFRAMRFAGADSIQIALPGPHRGIGIYLRPRFFTMSGKLWTVGDLSADGSVALAKLMPVIAAAGDALRAKSDRNERHNGPKGPPWTSAASPEANVRAERGSSENAGAHAPDFEAHAPDAAPTTAQARRAAEAADDFARLGVSPDDMPAAVAASPARGATPAFRAPLSDSEVLEKCRSEEYFRRIEGGDFSELKDQSHSGGDLALCQRIGFYSGGDRAQIDACFRQTALFREKKWDARRPGGTYGSKTIEFALDITSASYEPKPKRPVGRPAMKPVTAGSKVTPISGVTPSSNGVPHSSELPGAHSTETRETNGPSEAHLPHAESHGTESHEPPELQGSDELDYFPLTDRGNAQRLIHLFGENMRWSIEEKAWRYYRDGAWMLDPSHGQIHALAGIVTDRMRQGRSETVRKFAIRSQSTNAIKAMANAAAWEPGMQVAATVFDAAPDVLNTANGVIDLKTGQLLPGGKELLIGHRVHVPYIPGFRSDTWDQFLEAVVPDAYSREYLQRAAGYTLTGRISEECCFFLTGIGRNGKGAFLLALQHLLGAQLAGTANFSTFLYTRRDNTLDIASMRGKRMVVAQEATTGAKFNESVLKSLTGGDRVSAKLLYQNPIEFSPTAKLWFASNFLPEILDDSVGFWERMRVIRFPVSFAGNADLTLKDRLCAGEAQQAVLAWAVEGAVRWFEDSLPTPPAIESATAEYREESDTLTHFVDERCEREDGREIRARELYQAYDSWCRGINLTPISETAFGRRLSHMGFTRRTLEGRKIYQGLNLSDRLL